MYDNLSKIYDNKNFSDIKLIIRDDKEEITLFVSKAILSMNCDFFLNLFSGNHNDYDPTDDHFVLNVENARIFNEVIKVLYEIDVKLDIDDVFECLLIADKYGSEMVRDHFSSHVYNEFESKGETLERFLEIYEKYGIFDTKLNMYYFLFCLISSNKLIYEKDKLIEIINRDIAGLEEKEHVLNLESTESRLLRILNDEKIKLISC